MAQDHVTVGTVQNQNHEDVIGTPGESPSTASSRILANMEGGVWACDDDAEDRANSLGCNAGEL
jgi:hypothetical protein